MNRETEGKQRKDPCAQSCHSFDSAGKFQTLYLVHEDYLYPTVPHGHLPCNIRQSPMVIFLAISATMPPEFQLDRGSSLSSLNISTSHVTAQWNIAPSIKNPPKLIAVQYTRTKLLLSLQGQLALSRPSLILSLALGPGNVTTVRAKAQSTLAIIKDLGMKGLVSTLKGLEVTINIVAKAKRRL